MTAAELYAAGYTDLVSVIPPDGRMSPSSRIRPEARGKSPGKKYISGLWGGYNWLQPPTGPDVERMDRDGANIGLQAAKFPAVDIDIRDEALADVVDRAFQACGFGPQQPMRVGSWPKRLYPFRLVGEEFSRMQLFIYPGDDERHLVEILGAGQQYLVAGVHPGTKKPYEWRVPLPDSASDLPPLNMAQAQKVIDAIAAALIGLDQGITLERSGSGSIRERRKIDQDGLKATDMNVLELAIRSTPNTNELFPSREDYIRYGYAIRGASQEDPARGLAAYIEWAARWEGNGRGQNSPESVAADWDRMHGPYELGADYVFDVARQHGFDMAQYEFPDLPAAPTRLESPEEVRSEAVHSDLWLADRFVGQYAGGIRFVPAWGKWLAWDGTLWRDDISRAVPGYIARVCATEANTVLAQIAVRDASAAERKAAQASAKALSSVRAVDAIERLARNDRRIISHPDDWDIHKDLLATPAGVIDLRDGTSRDADAGLFMARGTTVVPKPGKAARWYKFLQDATGGDAEMASYLQRMAGYCLTGQTKEHALFFIWGEGGRGKGTFVGALAAAFGPLLVRNASMTTFTSSKFDRHPTELAALNGARMVVAQETQEGRSWDEQRVKSLTGGDAVTARFLYQNEFTYTPDFKLVFTGNNRPHIENADEAMRRRIHLIPFDHLPPSKNLDLKDQLIRAELPAILQWAIDGAVEWYRVGLRPPERVLAATQEYFEDEDPMSRWLEDCCQQTGSASSAELYTSWVDWTDKNSENCGVRNKFGTRLRARGFRGLKQTRGVRMYQGISLKEAA